MILHEQDLMSSTCCTFKQEEEEGVESRVGLGCERRRKNMKRKCQRSKNRHKACQKEEEEQEYGVRIRDTIESTYDPGCACSFARFFCIVPYI